MTIQTTQQITDKYSVLNNTFRLDKIENPELDKIGEPKDEINTIIGDDKQPEFIPQLKLQRWTNEVNFSVRLIDKEVGKEKVETIGDKIKYSKGNIDIEFYDYDKGYKMVWFLKKKPKTNKVEFSIQSKGLDFFYQPSLKEEHEIGKEGAVEITDTDVKDKDGKVICHRPENVVGSYAVYHQTKGGMNDINGKEYKTGKFGHIYRPHLFDANGLEAWGKLHIENGIYSVEIPQDFLDNAVYPIKSNDTFGYDPEGSGASNSSGWTNQIRGSKFTLGEIGTVISLSAYVEWFTNFQLAIYTDAADPVRNGYTNNINGDSGFSYKTGNIAVGGELTADDWFLCINAGDTGTIKVDTSGGNDIYKAQTFGTWPNPILSPSTGNFIYSIYCTYTPSGGAGDLKSLNSVAFADIKSINGIAIADIKSINGISTT